MKQYPRKPPRYKQDFVLYFLTFCIFKRNPLLHLTGVPQLLIEELMFFERKIRKVIAYTIMPDHIHLIVEVEQAHTLSEFLRDFKKYTSREIKRRLTLLKMEVPDRIWQPGTMDHCIRMRWNNKDYENHLAYIFYNSLKHLGVAPKDFPFHNFREFVKDGVFEEDFCSIDDNILKISRIVE